MLYILSRLRGAKSRGQFSRKSLTPGGGSLMPPAIQRGPEVISRESPSDRASRKLLAGNPWTLQ